jgi:hypothetical protein
MAESRNSPFVMHSAREAIAGGLMHIEEQVQGIEKAMAENPGLVFDLAKTLVESVCRTVLRERNIPYSENDDLPKLFKNATQTLPFLPPEASGKREIRKSLERTLNGLHTAIQGICELRNRCGFASHGAAEPRPPMESVQALLAAGAADTIVGFLYRVHRQDRTLPASPRALFEANPAFNDFIDEAHGMIRIFESEFRPSQVLFVMEPESYRIHLAEYNQDAAAADIGAGSEAEAES